MTTTQKTTDVTAPRRSHWWWTVPGCLAMVLLNAAISYGIVRLNAPVTAAFNMKQTVDAFFDSASQKQLSEAQSKALSARFNTALEASLQAWQQKHHAVILVSPAVVQGAPDITREIQQDIARRMGAECGRRRSWHLGRSVAGKGAGHADGDHAAPDGAGAVR